MSNSYIHPTAILSDSVVLGYNTYIGPNCVIGFPGYQSQFVEIGPELKGIGAGKVTIGDNCRIYGNAVICCNSIIGNDCRIDYHSYIGESTKIGNNCDIKFGARIYDHVIISDWCSVCGFVSNNCIVKDHSIIQGDLIHKFINVKQGVAEPSPVIEENVFIGRKALVIGNVIVRQGTYAGCSAVITRDTNSNMLYLGIPAKEKKPAPKPFLDPSDGT